jgi:hypothetical protein
MKSTIIIIILFCANFGYAQSHQQSKFHFLNENGKIDSIMNIALSKEKSKNIYFSIKTIDWGYGHEFSITRHKKPFNEIYRLPWQKQTKIVGYFKFRGYLVLVVGSDEPNDYFKKADPRKTFYFTRYSDSVDYGMNDEDVRNNGKWVFIFENQQWGDKPIPSEIK